MKILAYDNFKPGVTLADLKQRPAATEAYFARPYGQIAA